MRSQCKLLSSERRAFLTQISHEHGKEYFSFCSSIEQSLWDNKTSHQPGSGLKVDKKIEGISKRFLDLEEQKISAHHRLQQKQQQIIFENEKKYKRLEFSRACLSNEQIQLKMQQLEESQNEKRQLLLEKQENQQYELKVKQKQMRI